MALTDRAWLDWPSTRRLVAVLTAGGIAYRFVGGAVRDGLLGRPVADVDLATSALPAAVMDALEAGDVKAVPTGLAHGTVTAVVDGRHFEITTLRRDVETDGRHARVAFTDDWRADAARRDFTMNALYCDADGTILDFFGGIEDALAGRVRFIGDPAARIAEDALRILRFFRFNARYGRGAFDPAGLAACRAGVALLGRLSGERVRDEILKLLRAPDPVLAWTAMASAGIAAKILPEAGDTESLARLVALEAALGSAAESIRRLAALTGPQPDTVLEGLKRRLKLSNQAIEHLRAIARLGLRVDWIEQGAYRRALYGADRTALEDAALLAHAWTGHPSVEALRAFRDAAAGWRKPRFPLSGRDLEAAGVAPGPEMGHLLRTLEDWWVDRDFRPGRAEILKEAERLLTATPPGAAGT